MPQQRKGLRVAPVRKLLTSVNKSLLIAGTVGMAGSCCVLRRVRRYANPKGRRTMMSTIGRREFFTAVSFLAVTVALGTVATMLDRRAAAQSKAAVQAPMFEVDPLWPKPLPHNWVLGNAIGIAVDGQDHIWMIHRTSGVNDNFKAP